MRDNFAKSSRSQSRSNYAAHVVKIRKIQQLGLRRNDSFGNETRHTSILSPHLGPVTSFTDRSSSICDATRTGISFVDKIQNKIQ